MLSPEQVHVNYNKWTNKKACFHFLLSNLSWEKKQKWVTYREQILPELKISLMRLINYLGGPTEQHYERATCKGESWGKPRVCECIQHLLVINVEHHIQCPPCCKVYLTTIFVYVQPNIWQPDLFLFNLIFL